MGRCYQPDLLIDLMAAIGTAVFLVGHFDFGLFFRPTVAFTRPGDGAPQGAQSNRGANENRY
jgi:hypothetical protein